MYIHAHTTHTCMYPSVYTKERKTHTTHRHTQCHLTRGEERRQEAEVRLTVEEEDHASANDEQKGEDLGVGEHVLNTRRPPHIVAVDGCQDACNNNTLYLIVTVEGCQDACNNNTLYLIVTVEGCQVQQQHIAFNCNSRWLSGCLQQQHIVFNCNSRWLSGCLQQQHIVFNCNSQRLSGCLQQ